MFLSPILILTLLFSSCDDNSEKALETKTIEFSGTTTTAITGITGTSGTLTLEASGIQEPSNLSGEITVTIAEGKGTFNGKVTAPKETTLGESLTWTGTAKIEGGSEETVTKLVIEGTFSEEGNTYTVTKATATLQATVTSIEVTGIGSISNFSGNQPSEEVPNAITLTPPEGVTPSTALKGKLSTEGEVAFTESINLTAPDENTLKTGWKIKAEWTSSESKACTITETTVEASKVTYTSGDKKLTFTFSESDLTIATT